MLNKTERTEAPHNAPQKALHSNTKEDRSENKLQTPWK